jgi:6-phosphogluconate dehydrogenase
MGKAHLGVIGLAVMGRNLVLNLSDHGLRVAVYNRTWERTRDLLTTEAAGRDILGCPTLAELVGALRTPRVVLLMVKAGVGVDAVLDQLLPLLAPGDVIVDGGNSHYGDTARRYEWLARAGIRFIGMGVSGGEEGARQGPSLMPGGDPAAWPLVRGLFQPIAAQAEGEPCCQWVGEGGAGHYVKMVHNGIEYGDMQLIAEAYDLLRQGLGLDTDQLAAIFARWNRGPLESYLIEITAAILAVRNPDGTPRLDLILDSAGQKGTGRWTSVDALELGVPLTLIGEAVNARYLSALKEERERASAVFPSVGAARVAAAVMTPRGLVAMGPAIPDAQPTLPESTWVQDVHDALYAAKLISYAQGFMLLRAASQRFGWHLAYGDIALLWRGGCIIRSRFLGEIKRAFDRNPDLENLLLDDFFAAAIRQAEPGWRRTVALGVELGIPLPALSAALAFFDAYRRPRLPANLLQAQRDYFGAHTYARIDAPDGQRFHTDWTGDRREKTVDE